jgi:hypothetical protein
MQTKKFPLATASVGALDLANSCWLLLPFSLVGNTLHKVVSFRRQLLGEKISQVVVCVHFGRSRCNGLSYAVVASRNVLLGQIQGWDQ